MRWIFLILSAAAAAGILLYTLWYSGSVERLESLRARNQEIARRNQALREQNRALEDNIQEIKTGGFTLEAIVREQLHYTRKDEVVFVFQRPATATAPARPGE
ncbi:MAG: Cell division protein FtsB [Myxococcota bacterium]|nr:Cell division protein FtsB [Myxococcota bacterium]